MRYLFIKIAELSSTFKNRLFIGIAILTPLGLTWSIYLYVGEGTKYALVFMYLLTALFSSVLIGARETGLKLIGRSTTKARKSKLNKLELFFAALLQKPSERESMLGCLEEVYRKDVKRHGKIGAKFLFWLDILKSIPTAALGFISKILWEYIIK